VAGFSITEAAFTGFGVLRRHPLAAIVWSFVSVVFLGVVLLLFGGALITAIMTVARVGNGDTPPAATILELIGGSIGFFLVLLIGLTLLSAIITCAVFRAVLEPNASSFFYMRLGASELWLILVNIVLGLLMFAVSLAMAIPLGIITLMTAHSVETSLVVRIIGQLVINGVTIWLRLRLSMSAPMTFADRQFRLFESWTLTRGHGWALFAVALLLGLLGLAGGATILGGLALGDNLKTLFLTQPPEAVLSMLVPLMALGLTLLMVAGVVLTPVFFAPWARIYQRLKPGADIASTFA